MIVNELAALTRFKFLHVITHILTRVCITHSGRMKVTLHSIHRSPSAHTLLGVATLAPPGAATRSHSDE